MLISLQLVSITFQKAALSLMEQTEKTGQEMRD